MLLTKEEAAAHRQIDEPKHHYDSLFLRKVSAKHDTGRNHFIRLPWLVKYVKSKTTKAPRDAILAEAGGGVGGGSGKETGSKHCRVRKSTKYVVHRTQEG